MKTQKTTEEKIESIKDKSLAVDVTLYLGKCKPLESEIAVKSALVETLAKELEKSTDKLSRARTSILLELLEKHPLSFPREIGERRYFYPGHPGAQAPALFDAVLGDEWYSLPYIKDDLGFMGSGAYEFIDLGLARAYAEGRKVDFEEKVVDSSRPDGKW